MAKITQEMMLDWYRQMILIREFEEACQHLYEQKRITGVYLHLYSGHEAIGVGAVANMVVGKDHIITAYRDHGIALSIGCDPGATMAEMMGKRTGLSGGKGGSMHLASRAHNFWGGYAIVGGHLPLATGIALESQYNNQGAVVISMIGDGATNNGYFHEALNMSGAWKLPNIWIIENNGYGMGTEVERVSGNPILHERARGYGIRDMERVDGQDVVVMYETLMAAKEYALEAGPVLIEAMTYRYRGHGVSDKQYNTRLAEELAEWKANKDPITILKRHILAADPKAEKTLSKIEAEQHKVVEEAVNFAENSPLPDTYAELMAHIYVD